MLKRANAGQWIGALACGLVGLIPTSAAGGVCSDCDESEAVELDCVSGRVGAGQPVSPQADLAGFECTASAWQNENFEDAHKGTRYQAAAGFSMFMERKLESNEVWHRIRLNFRKVTR